LTAHYYISVTMLLVATDPLNQSAWG